MCIYSSYHILEMSLPTRRLHIPSDHEFFFGVKKASRQETIYFLVQIQSVVERIAVFLYTLGQSVRHFVTRSHFKINNLEL